MAKKRHTKGRPPPETQLIGRAAAHPVTADALKSLLTAWRLATDAGADPWQFAVRIGELRALGVQESELRWLAARRYAEHAYETTSAGATERTFDRVPPALLDERSVFLLTASGARFAARELQAAGVASPSPAADPPPDAMPFWDPLRRELRLGNVIVKQYRRPAPQQQRILDVFQEEGWPQRIDDPLPQIPGMDPKHRLRGTIHGLNRNQRPRLIHFEGDGSGQGVLWQPNR